MDTKQQYLKLYKKFINENRNFLSHISDSSYMELAEWFDIEKEFDGTDDEPMSGEAFEFANFIWKNVIRPFSGEEYRLCEFDLNEVISDEKTQVVTDDLRKVRIISTDAMPEKGHDGPIIAAITDYTGDEIILRYDEDGKPDDEKYRSMPAYYNLAILKLKKVGYVNICRRPSTGENVVSKIFPTEQEAIKESKGYSKQNKYLCTSRIEYFE